MCQKIYLCYDDDEDEESSIPLRDIIIFKLPSSFSNLLFDVDDDFSSSDNESFSDEDILKEIYLNTLFDEEIISIKIDLYHFNAESDLIESLLNQDSSIIFSSKNLFLKILMLQSNLSPSPILAEDRDSLRDEINLSLTLDDLMPLGIENDDYDSEGDILILEELLSNDSLSLPENESFHFDIPSSPRPPAKPPDDDDIEPNLEILTVKVVGDIFEYYVPIPRILPTQPTLASNREKSPHLLSHGALKLFSFLLKAR
nr:hypothetical protein [Tanacetum cinerariifolium]